MNWTIRNKIIAIGVAVAATILALASIAYVTNQHTSTAVQANQGRTSQLQVVERMSKSVLRVLLGAMDSVVDKDEGSINPERKAEIDSELSYLKEQAPHLKALADTDEERRLADLFAERLADFESGIQIDLVNAIENRASQAAFAELDDKVDGNGEALMELLEQLAGSVQGELDESSAALHASLAKSTMLAAGSAIAGLLFVVTFLFIVGRGILVLIDALKRAMGQLAEGDLSADVPATERRDELGEMARAVQVFKENAIEKERMQAEQAEQERLEREREAERQRQAEKEQRRAQTVLQVAQEMEQSVMEVVEAVASAATELQSAAETMTDTAERANQQTSAGAAASEQTSANVQTVASATEELSSSVGEIGGQVEQSTRIATKAVESAQRANETVEELATASQKIGDVVSHHRGGARRRCRQGLHGGRLRGQEPGYPDRQGNPGHRLADHGDAGADQRHGGGHRGHPGGDRRDQRDRRLDRLGGRGAGCGDPGDRPQRPAGGPGHAGGLVQHFRGQHGRRRDRRRGRAGAAGLGRAVAARHRLAPEGGRLPRPAPRRLTPHAAAGTGQPPVPAGPLAPDPAATSICSAGRWPIHPRCSRSTTGWCWAARMVAAVASGPGPTLLIIIPTRVNRPRQTATGGLDARQSPAGGRKSDRASRVIVLALHRLRRKLYY
jgi:methyl-accepting chemotaxis protein